MDPNTSAPGAAVDGSFNGGNPYAQPRKPSTVATARFLNSIRSELLNVLAQAGVTPDATDDTQLLQALQELYVQGLPPEQQGVLFSQSRVWQEPTRTLERIYRAYGSFTVGAAGGLWPRDRYEEAAGGVATGTARFSGTNGTLIPAGTQIVDAVNGYFYDTDADGTISGGIADIACTALNVGAQSNLSSGTHVFDLASPISGVNDAVDAQTNFTGGADGEYYNCPGPETMTGATSTSHGTALLDSGCYDTGGPLIRRGRMGPGAILYVSITGRLLQNDGSNRNVFLCLDPNGNVYAKANSWGSGRALVLRGTIAAGAAPTERPFRWDTWIIGLDTSRQLVISKLYAPGSSNISGHRWDAAASPIELHWGVHDTTNLFNFTTPLNSRASGTARFSGTVGTFIPARTVIVSVATSLRFTTRYSCSIGSGGTVDVTADCLERGTAGNEASGTDKFTLETAIAGVDTDVDAQSSFTGGSENFQDNKGHVLMGLRWAISGAYDDTARLEPKVIEAWISRDGGELGGLDQ